MDGGEKFMKDQIDAKLKERFLNHQDEDWCNRL